MLRRNVAERAPPEDWRGHEVLAAGPLITREAHRAVLDGDQDVVVFSEADERTPCLEEARPIVVHALRPITADECIHGPQPEQGGGLDDFLEMIHRDLR